jgi:hypothetical protein
MSKWEVIRLALRERRPALPGGGLGSCAFLVVSGLTRAALHHGWLDWGFTAIGVVLAVFLILRHRARMKVWRRGADSFRALTGREP